MSEPVALLTSMLSHGATIITASPDRSVNTIPVPRLGDVISCPIHGVNSIVTVLTQAQTNNRATANVSSVAACGAVILTGSTNTYVG